MTEVSPTATISFVCPCYNEAEVIGLFYDRLTAVIAGLDSIEADILFVDDGSSDSTLDALNQIAARDPRVRVCSLSRNFGHQIALTAGLDHAVGDAVVMLDTDLQHPPELITEMVEKWRAGYDIVSAVRRDTKGASWFKNVTSSGFYRLINRLSDTHIPNGVADFSLLSARVYEPLREMRERHRFVRGMISWIGFKRAFVSYDAQERAAGQSKYTPMMSGAMAMDALFSFSSSPLRLGTHAGVVITLFGFSYLAWILVRNFVLHDLVAGWASLIAVVLILGGAQLLFIGLIGQYLARVFEEAKGRPIYIAKQLPAPRGRTQDDA